MSNTLVSSITVIFVGASFFSTAALLFRQSLLVAYIILGIFVQYVEPAAFVENSFIQYSGDIGIIFLLFLLGLHLDPIKLVDELKKVTLPGVISSILFWLISYVFLRLYGYAHLDSALAGAALLFSSTIIGLKLLPPNLLQHGYVGEMMIGMLLIQDFLAIAMLFMIDQLGNPDFNPYFVLLMVLMVPVVVYLIFKAVDLAIEPLMNRFARVREYLFLVAIAWGLGIATLAEALGASYEIGAFLAGISLAHQSVSGYLSETLMPLRDFFLVIFFFAVGMTIDIQLIQDILLPAFLLAVVLITLKPLIYKYLFMQIGQSESFSWEIGFRLGQASEFSILVTEIAKSQQYISNLVANLVELTTLITFLFSSYLVVKYYRTPGNRDQSIIDEEEEYENDEY